MLFDFESPISEQILSVSWQKQGEKKQQQKENKTDNSGNLGFMLSEVGRDNLLKSSVNYFYVSLQFSTKGATGIYIKYLPDYIFQEFFKFPGLS